MRRLQESSARIMARMSYAMDMSSGIGNVFSPLMTTLVVSLGAWLVITHQLTKWGIGSMCFAWHAFISAIAAIRRYVV